MNATSVKVGYLWDTPRDENLHTSEVVMEKEHGGSVLRLICSISPPLPTDEHHWELRNELVQWYKNGPKGETFENPRYWSDDMTRTAISFVKVTLDVLGTYSCSYVANVDVAKTLKKPQNLMELKTYVSYMKDKSGITGWTDRQELLPVSENVLSCIMELLAYIHQIRASDIKVIAAMGDTFTLGLGARATSLNGFFTNYEGISWSQFSPALKGAPGKGSSNGVDVDLNVAFAGASANDLQDQAIDLVSRLKIMKGIDFKDDWKLLTVWIGTEDLCQVCKDADKFSPSSFIKYLMRMLSYLQKKVPRLFVNLVPPMNVSSLHQLDGERTQSCEILEWNSCPCLKSAVERKRVSEAVKEYKNLLDELVNSGLYDIKENFAVVIQPALQGLPRTQLEPFGSKTKTWGDQETLKCPSEDKPYIFTKINSKIVSSDTSARDDDDNESSRNFPPAAAVALAVCLTSIVVIVVVSVWRSRKSRRRPEATRLLYAPGPYKPKI
ncbi:Phospholipase B1 [Acropora cervicornis]|uniref:Phospholipase B1 n=1 Tax=Acropora cervicornis TaxID=6130 RepID=A0AAD9VAW2_ACRCE|nr:Phospholipase B1 [Acropora cervicornis]